MRELTNKLKKLLKDESILDILIFGSFAKHATRKRDLDLAILTEKEIERISLKRKLEQMTGKEIDLQIVSLKDYDKFIWIALIREGFSVKHNVYLHEVYGIKPCILYKYSLKPLSLSKKVMFERAIRSFKNIEKLSNRVVLVPIEQSGEFADFLRQWNIDIDAQEYGLLPLVRKRE